MVEEDGNTQGFANFLLQLAEPISPRAEPATD